MKTVEDKVEETNNYEEVAREREPSTSSNYSATKTIEPQKAEGTEGNKAATVKLEELQFSPYKNSSPTQTTPSIIGDNQSEINAEVVLRPKVERFSAVVTPNGNLLDPRASNSTSDLRNSSRSTKNQANKGKNDMVLQLVFPNNRNSNNNANRNYLTASSIEDILGHGHLKERHSRPHSINTQQDLYLSQPNGSYINHSYSACDLTEYGNPGESPGGYSIPITPLTSNGCEKPTPPEERKRAFTGLLTNVLSVCFALFNITAGLAVYVSDLVDGTTHVAEVFSLVLVSVAFLYILYLTIDIQVFMNKKRKYEKLLNRNTPDSIEMKETPDGHFEFSIPLPEVIKLKRPLQHDYCFRKDRHSGNFYLKVGAAGFCFGHLIHSGLIIGYQVVFITSDEEAFYECASVATLVLDILYPLYSFLLLFFMFKYSNVIINKHRTLAHFGVMHCLSSSVCFWVWTIFRETLEALAYKDYKNETTTTISSLLTEIDDPADSHYIEISPRRFTAMCDIEDESLSTIYRDYSPYLYPFSVEYSILVVGVLYLVWQNIGVCTAEDKGNGGEEDLTRECKSPSGNKDNMESNIVVHADCHSSSKGLFGGFIILVFTVVSTILFFIAIYTDEGRNALMGVNVNIATSLTILSLMTLACVLAYRQITKLDLNTAHHNLLDDILLFICIPAYFLNGIFSIIPAIIYSNVVGSINICLEVFQVLLQTCFILDGLRRSSNTKGLRNKKPGREMVTFLIICNVSLWIMQTFEVKSHGLQDNRYDFYGKELWTILGHTCLPLMMFYRFHASVCIGDIWQYAYQPPGH